MVFLNPQATLSNPKARRMWLVDGGSRGMKEGSVCRVSRISGSNMGVNKIMMEVMASLRI